jgi:hypothetical protein
MPGIDGGLEIVTSDGALAEKLQRANHRLSCEFSVRIKGLLGPDHIEAVKTGKLDRVTRMTVESVGTSEAQLEGSNRWYSIVVRGASGKDIRQLFERQRAREPRAAHFRGNAQARQSPLAGPAPATDRRGSRGAAAGAGGGSLTYICSVATAPLCATFS